MSLPTAAEDLLLEAVALHPAESWVVLGGSAAFVAELAELPANSEIRWQPADVRDVIDFGTGCARVRVQEPGGLGDTVQGALIVAPPDRDLARRYLLLAGALVVPHGRVVVAGANAEGIKSIIADGAKLLGSPLREGYGQKQRLAVFAAGRGDTPPAWANEAGVDLGTWATWSASLANQEVPLVTQAGVFPGAKVDAGTRLLLDAMPDVTGQAVLDVGCGAGVIGIAAALARAARVVMVDASRHAVQAARENARRLELSQVTVTAGDVFPDAHTEPFDLVVSNPPFHRGKEIDSSVADRLILEAPQFLTPDGTLLVVANAFLAYGKRMERVFAVVDTVVANRQFHVIRASEPRRSAD